MINFLYSYTYHIRMEGIIMSALEKYMRAVISLLTGKH